MDLNSIKIGTKGLEPFMNIYEGIESIFENKLHLKKRKQ